jgi:hypothetical protein
VFSSTVILTVATFESLEPSFARQVKESVPTKFGPVAGVYVQKPDEQPSSSVP